MEVAKAPLQSQLAGWKFRRTFYQTLLAQSRHPISRLQNGNSRQTKEDIKQSRAVTTYDKSTVDL